MSVFFYKPRSCWACQWSLSGKRKRKYFKTENEATAYDSERKQKDVDEARPTMGELIVVFFKHHEDYNHETKKKIVYLFAGYEKDGKHISGAGEFLRDKYADSLTRIDLENLRENIKGKGRAGNSTCNKFQAYIRAILAWGADQSLISFNPWRDFKRLPTKQRLFTATLADFQRILVNCPEWLKWAFATAYACSLRFGQVELFSLQWSAFQWRGGYVQLFQGKSGRLKRVFPPKEYMIEAQKRYEEDVRNGIVYVCHRNGLRVVTYKEAWKTALKLSGLQGVNIRPYDIRHVAASEMLAAGADLAAVSSQLGHSSVVTTGTFYAHVTAGAQQRASAKLPSLDVGVQVGVQEVYKNDKK